MSGNSVRKAGVRRCRPSAGWGLAVVLGIAWLPCCLAGPSDRGKDDRRVESLRVNLEPGVEYGPEARKYQGIPGIERAPGGRLWAVWYAGKVHEDQYNYVVGATSGDDGKTWSDLKFVIDPDGDGPLRTYDPCPWLDPEGKLWIFWALAGGGGPPLLMAMTTGTPEDANPAWSAPRVLCEGVMMCKPLVTADGAWLLPTALWRREGSCRVVASSDKGKTWELRGTASVPKREDRDCDEPMILQRSDGSLRMLVRTRYGIGETVSIDGGRTWAPVAPSAIPHPTSRFFIRRLSSGSLLLVKHGPLDERTGRSHLTAYVSRDDGHTWLGGLLLDERNGASYPDGTESPGGTLYVIYDWNRADDKHILLATFTEEDVLAGKAKSGKVRTRVLVNRATGVNPKPWRKDGRFLNLSRNDDGAPLLAGPKAALQTKRGEIHEAAQGKPIFTNRPYTFSELPEPLRGRQFILAPMAGGRAVCRQAGVVYVLTPAPSRNQDSIAEVLTALGFAKARVPEFVLFLDGQGNAASANACTVYQKQVSPGEVLEWGKWGVVLF